MTRALVIPLSCPLCGDEMAHRQSSRPTSTEASAIMACPCGEVTQILVRALRVPPDMGATERRQRSRERASA